MSPANRACAFGWGEGPDCPCAFCVAKKLKVAAPDLPSADARSTEGIQAEEPPSADLIEITRRLNAATKGLTYRRYDRENDGDELGGGRAYLNGEAGKRVLALDAYNPADREFYFHALADITALLWHVGDMGQSIARLTADRDTLQRQLAEMKGQG